MRQTRNLRLEAHYQRLMNRRIDPYRLKDIEFYALAGNQDTGVLDVPGKSHTIYATIQDTGQVAEAVNSRVTVGLGTAIVVGYDALDQTKTMRVLRQWYAYPGETPADGVVSHHGQHEWDGSDTVWVHGEQFQPGMIEAVAGTLSVKIYPNQYKIAGEWKAYHQRETIDMTAHVATTAGKARYSLIVVDSAGAFQVRDGAEAASWEVLSDADKPEPTAGDSCLWFVKSFEGITSFRHTLANDYFEDARFAGASGGSTVPAPPATTASNDFQVGNGSGAWIKKTLAETKTILSVPSAVTVEEVDGTPSVVINKLKVPNGSLTNDGGGVVTLAIVGTGDVVGPASAIDGHLAVFDSTTGKLIKDGGAPGAGSTPSALTLFIYQNFR